MIYGAYFTASENRRAGLDNEILINGSPISYGAASTYSRDTTNNDHFVRGGTIVEVAQGDSIDIASTRSDNADPQDLLLSLIHI